MDFTGMVPVSRALLTGCAFKILHTGMTLLALQAINLRENHEKFDTILINEFKNQK